MMKALTSEMFVEASNHILGSIMRKRANKPLSSTEIGKIIEDFISGLLPDYQMSAWLATIASIGMDIDEIESLTRAYVAGKTYIDHTSLGHKVVDKHSTGGVGDKVTFVVVPIVAACGVLVTKISGRGLGHAGGTLDKLESLAGLKLDLNVDELSTIIKEVGMVMTGQSGELVPGDKATYQLRNISGSVESIPLIAASIISKKVATGANCLVLDVKTGAGALIQDYEKSIELAETMVELAARFGINTRAVISDMSQPLGYAVGNALEIKEALAVLQGENIPGLTNLCYVVARLMLQAANSKLSKDEANEQVSNVISNGSAYNQFLKWAQVQGGNVQQLLNPELLPTAQYKRIISAKKSGWVHSIDPRMIGNAALRLSGATKELKGSVLDHSAGVVLHKRVGDKVVIDESLAEIHYNGKDPTVEQKMVDEAFTIANSCPSIAPIIHKII